MSELLNERGKTHGTFTSNAFTAQEIKKAILSGIHYEKLNHVQRESLDMIASKISRILSGNADFLDHWEDIRGYTDLAISDIKGRQHPLANAV